MQDTIHRGLFPGRSLTQCAVALVAALGFGLAFAQGSLRMLPPEAKKGEMLPPAQARMVIDGKIYMIAPGIRIRDTRNMIVFPGSVTSPASVRFTLDPMGLVDRVWILTPQEAAMPDPEPEAK